MVAELLVKEDWSFALYKRHDEYILSVVCGGVGVYELNIPISEKEATAGLADIQVLQAMANDIRTYPTKYQDRSVVLKGR